MRKRALPIVLAALVAIVAARATTGSGGSTGPVGATVVRPVDGDTIRVEAGGRSFSVRLLGIDTPETHRPGTPVECGGLEASANMARLVRAGERVTLEPDPTQDHVDRYGRLLAYVRLHDGTLVEDAQLAGGWATVYVYGDHPVRRYGQFVRDQAAARQAGRGVWRECGGDFHSSRR